MNEVLHFGTVFGIVSSATIVGLIIWITIIDREGE